MFQIYSFIPWSWFTALEVKWSPKFCTCQSNENECYVSSNRILLFRKVRMPKFANCDMHIVFTGYNTFGKYARDLGSMIAGKSPNKCEMVIFDLTYILDFWVIFQGLCFSKGWKGRNTKIPMYDWESFASRLREWNRGSVSHLRIYELCLCTSAPNFWWHLSLWAIRR